MSNYSKNLKRKTRRRNRSKSTSRYHQKYPRLVVYRSNKHFESQIINDFDGVTLISCSSKDSDIKKDLSQVKNKTELSVVVGKNLAKAAIKKKIKKVVFDRNGYPFHGRVKAFADSARKAGLEF
tara:strand:- start:221 stop:592 length:372 start_codon:yes stop_codon:yes gene_type:complete